MRICSVIFRPEWRLRRSGLGVEVDSVAAPWLGSAEEVVDVVVVGEDVLVVAWPRAEAGTEVRARSRLSIESRRSAANRWMANCLAESMSRLVRSWRLRKSATERRYLS